MYHPMASSIYGVLQSLPLSNFRTFIAPKRNLVSINSHSLIFSFLQPLATTNPFSVYGIEEGICSQNLGYRFQNVGPSAGCFPPSPLWASVSSAARGVVLSLGCTLDSVGEL